MLKRIQRFTRAVWQRLPTRLKINAARSTQPKFTVSATAIIVNENCEVLLLEHVLRPASGWALPGGFLKPQEQPEDAIRREIREEIGLELDSVKPFRVRTHRTHVEIFFLADPIGEPRINSLEILDFKWFTLDAVPTDMSRTQQTLIHEVLKTGFDKNTAQGLKSDT